MMEKFRLLTSVLLVFIYLQAGTAVSQRTTFKAAVYAHAVTLPPRPYSVVSRSEALSAMMKNLHVYSVQASRARQQGADIIVFPEDGIYGLSFARKTLTPYLEFIPDPKHVTWTPCDEPHRYGDSRVQTYLSCLAKHNSLYLVANFGDRQPCSKFTDAECPDDRHYQFNTDVVYDPHGRFLAKYHKKHLYYESQFDAPNQPEIATFDTTFGKFGVFTCFDILFHDPPIKLVETYGVGNIILPTAWMRGLPLMSSVQFNSAFARGLGVNFLAANVHFPSFQFYGSGIYTPNGAAAFYFNTSVSSGGKLIVSEIDVIRTPRFVSDSGLPTTHTPSHNDPNVAIFQSKLFEDRFNFVQLTQPQASLRVCHNRLCCVLNYSRTSSNTELYAFGAFDGVHNHNGKYYLQVCALVKCANNSRESCGTGTKEAHSYFNRLNMSGTFETPYILPQVLMSDGSSLALAPGQWDFRQNVKAIESQKGFDKPLVSASLIGRIYTRDNPTASIVG